MSVVDQLKNLFGIKEPASESDSQLGTAMPHGSLDSMATEQMLDLPDQPAAPVLSANRTDPAPASDLDDADSDMIALPILGRRSVGDHQRLLAVLLGASLIVLAIVAIFTQNRGFKSTQQLGVVGQSLLHSQRLAKLVSQATQGTAPAFAEVVQSSGIVSKSIRGLKDGDDQINVTAVATDLQPDFDRIMPLMERTEKNSAAIVSQQKALVQVGAARRLINRQSADLLELADAVLTHKIQQNAPTSEIAAAGQLVMLTQRIGKSANEFLTSEGVSPEAVFLMGKDLNTFKEIMQGLVSGSSELRLSAAKDAQAKEQLAALGKLFEETRTHAGAILGNLQGLVAAREAEASLLTDSEPLRLQLEQLQGKLQAQTGVGGTALSALVGSALLALLCAGGLSYVQLLDSRKRAQVAEAERLRAEHQEQEAKRVNDANQAAILRLMNELQMVAEGDLTQEATVTEDITGAIADSVNYTVEELRSLVGNVQGTAGRVGQTTAEVDATSTELLAASNEQLHEIRETGNSVVAMASRITEVSVQARESAAVAKQSRQAAEVGLLAVQNTIGGMNAIRDQIQETSKRIKRLGESSQEIGEITELISDITEQTNVLALNAAIQAASAGEAGRGFSVVAEEVQRLAERSAEATRQISALVKAIQTDTQDAVGAMERSTQGVVEGAKLSDGAGSALTEIDQVSRRLAELIENISSSTSREAELAKGVADNIQHIFAVTEQTGEGTRSTAAQVRELSKMAEELRQSVSRFKIA